MRRAEKRTTGGIFRGAEGICDCEDASAEQHAVYQAARNKHPVRWSGRTRNWQPIGTVWLNPERSETRREGHGAADALPNEAGGGGPMAGKEHHAA